MLCCFVRSLLSFVFVVWSMGLDLFDGWSLELDFVLLDCALRWVLGSGLFIWDCYLTILAVFSPLAGHSAIRPSRLRRVFSAICASFSLPPGFSWPSLLHLCSPRVVRAILAFFPLSALFLRFRRCSFSLVALFAPSSLYFLSHGLVVAIGALISLPTPLGSIAFLATLFL
jgi:hypothetical protein